MAKQKLETIKNWFKTSLKPTQQHFWDTWDSFWHKDDKIPTSSIENLDVRFDEKADAELVTAHFGDPEAHGIHNKVDKEAGKGLSANDYTTAEKEKLADIQEAATANEEDDYLLDRTNHTGAQEISTVNGLQGALDAKADLVNGKVPTAQLPAYVDDVLEYANLVNFPETGENGKIYIAQNTNITYRWSGSAYVAIGSDLALGETSNTAFRGDYGKTAYDHSQLTSGNPHQVSKADVGLGNVDNTSDSSKSISAATQTALNAKADLVEGKVPASQLPDGGDNDQNAVHKTGNETVAGEKIFSDKFTIGKKLFTASKQTIYNAEAINPLYVGSLFIGDGGQHLPTEPTGPFCKYNTGIGIGALNQNTIGHRNTAVGSNGLQANTTGGLNTAIGVDALSLNTTGSQNTSVGTVAMSSNSTGGNNVALGFAALNRNTTGSANLALGAGSLGFNTTGGLNVAVGVDVLYRATGSYNTVVGSSSLREHTTGSNNTVLGCNSGAGLLTGSNNSIIGANVKDIEAALSNNIIIADGSGKQRIRVLNNGYTGIDKTNPAAKLDVNGNIIANAATSDNHVVIKSQLDSSLTSKADLVNGKVPASQLPENISSGGSIGLGETADTAYRGDRGKIAYDHSQLITGNPHNTGISDISGLQSALNAKAADTNVVHKTGNETVEGEKIFNGKTKIAKLGLGIAADLASYLSLAPGSSNITQILFTYGDSYTGTTEGAVWGETADKRLRIFRNNEADDFLFKGLNKTLAGTGNAMLIVAPDGTIERGPALEEGFTLDNDIISAITGATYASNRATIAPANSKVFYQGELYDDGTNTYIAVADNEVRRW